MATGQTILSLELFRPSFHFIATLQPGLRTATTAAEHLIESEDKNAQFICARTLRVMQEQSKTISKRLNQTIIRHE